MLTRAEVGAMVARACAEREVPCEPVGRYGYVVTLPGTRRLATTCHLVVGERSLRVSAFVLRAPEERRGEVWEWLLRRNARMYLVAFAIDGAGDIYLAGRLPLAAVTEAELDRLLGAVLSYADEAFEPLLALGFGGAIRREWAWRTSRGEPTGNLAAFRHLAPGDDPAG